ncbi:MAG: RNA methyltransferase [Bacteroidetes bacterium HGW-Bacteroidetes-9]|jgi:tRNA G18 (ribose-2'-O)-methylase SpoU|nr:MAG: RNA methyltransferase [Bacteroidetes bacterium HGW-Bacteroidetes-9]
MKKLSTDEIKRLSVADFKEAQKLPVVIVLDNVRSQHNIGSVFRTADAFRLEAIHLCGITATPPNREIHKTALGATESVDWKYFSTTAESIQELKAAGYKIVAIEQATGSLMINNFTPELPDKFALVFGNEVHGIEDDIIHSSDFCLEIPQTGTKHSLNVSVSAGIVLWEFFKKMTR